jgi:hypothetical protein
MRNGLVVLWILLCSVASAAAQVSVGIGLPGVSIGINLPAYPQLVAVPGYPVYYAPQVDSNYFFYDGMYWVYQRDNWYASSWYNGPWGLVAPEAVPLYVLRVPVRYYRQPPVYFRGWRADAPPRWGEHWGSGWERSHGGWDNWNRNAVPMPAPLPVYQRQYSGNRYPRVEQQQVLQTQNYRYQPPDAVVQHRYQAQRVETAPAYAPQTRQGVPQQRSSPPQYQQGVSRPTSLPQGLPPAPHGPPPQQGNGGVQMPPVAQVTPQQGAASGQYLRQPSPQGAAPREQQTPKGQGLDHQEPQGKGPAHESNQGGQNGPDKGDPQGGDRNK